MENKKRLQELNNRKMEQLEKIKLENEMLDYMATYEYSLELEIENKELLNDVISDILKL